MKSLSLRQWLWERLKELSCLPHAMENDCQFAGNSHNRSLFATLAASDSQLQTPAT
jgi:hypothetical protein